MASVARKAAVVLGAFLAAVSARTAEAGGMVYAAGECAGDISGLRVAIFREEGFPSESPRDAGWYLEVMEGAGLEVTAVGAVELSDPTFLTGDRFDALFMATGGHFPVDSEESIGGFLNSGGTVVIDGNMMTSGWSPPDEIAAKWRDLESAYRAGELRGDELHEYQDFIYKHGLAREPNLFRYSEELGRWAPPIEGFYYSTQTSRSYFGEFDLWPWPNRLSQAAQYRRPFDEDLSRNPVLAEAGLMDGLPDVLRREIYVTEPESEASLPGMPPQRTKYTASASREDGFLRPWAATRRDPDVPEYANNIKLSLYLFADVSNRRYAGVPDAGVQEKDRESDFYIVRYHTALRKGGTLLHFGAAGAHLLKSDDGAEVLVAALRLSQSRLPGERRQEFIDAFHRLDASLREYQGVTIGLMDEMEGLSRALLYSGEEGESARVAGMLNGKRGEFEDISGRGERVYLMAGERADSASHRERVALTGEIERLTEKNRALSGELNARLSGMADVPGEKPVSHRFGRLTYGFSHIHPAGRTRVKGLYPLIDKLGFALGPYYFFQNNEHSQGFELTEKMYRDYGISSGYRMAFSHRNHWAASDFEMGILNPDTGEVTTRRHGWFETEDDWKIFEEDISWFLRKVSEKPGISYVVHFSERDFAWSYWGERMEKRFRLYLEEKYGSAEELNSAWNTGYGDFADISLPTARPRTQQEHALWENWTRYREIYYIEEEVKPELDIIARHAPGLWNLAYSTYHRQRLHPANAVNHYEVKKLFQEPVPHPIGRHLHNKILGSDIAGGDQTFTTEWNVFYSPPAAAGAQVDRLRDHMWKGLSLGQIGIHTYMGSNTGRHTKNFINLDNKIMPLGWSFKGLVDEFRLFQHIILDGEREEPQVRVLYSPTTRRHTSWPGIEADMPMEEMIGHYSALNRAHIPVRAIDEGAVMDGYLSDKCRLLILPRVRYMNDDLLENVLKYVEAGGSVLINPETGRYNQYGHRKDSLLSLAGIAATDAADPAVVVGGKELRVGAMAGAARGLAVLFPDETEVIMSYLSGEAALTRTDYGRGSILVSGLPFGQSYINEWASSPGAAVEFIRAAAAAAGAEIEYEVSDADITIRPWKHGGRKYLVLVNPAREGMVMVEGAGFPFQRAPRMTPFDMKIKGNVRLTDYVLGMDVPGEFDGEYTSFSGLIPSPGGVVFEVSERRRGLRERLFGRAGGFSFTGSAEAAGAAGEAENRRELPFEGQLFADDGRIKMGDYILEIDVDTRGLFWGGDVYLNVEREGVKLRRQLSSGQTINFPFLDMILRVEVINAFPNYPAHIEATISEEKRSPSDSSCAIKEEEFAGQESLVMENEYLRVRILPGLGGRIIEFVSLSDGVNHMYSDRDLIGQGWGHSWSNYGGLEVNAGAFPGPFWNARFSYRVEKETPEEVRLALLRTDPIEWSHGRRGSGTNSLEKVYTLRKGESFLRISNRIYNHLSGPAELRLRVRPQYDVGGMGGGAHLAFYSPVGITSAARPFRRPYSEFWDNQGAWAAAVNTHTRQGVVKSFDEEELKDLYVYTSDNFSNFEITTAPVEADPGGYIEFEYNLGLLQGISGLTGFGGGAGLHTSVSGPEVFGNEEEAEWELEVSSLREMELETRTVVSGEAGVFDVGSSSFACGPESPHREKMGWNTGRHPDGEYSIKTVLSDGEGRELFTAARQISLRGGRRRELMAKVEGYEERMAAARAAYDKLAGTERMRLRGGIARSAILIEELKSEVQKSEPEDIPGLKSRVERQLDELEDKLGITG